MGGSTIRIKNKSISTQRRKRNPLNKGDDIEDPYIIGKKKHWPWQCKKCGWDAKPYKEDVYGDIIVSCTNPGCILNKIHEHSFGVEMIKLLKQQQMNSSLYYRRYDGGYY